ncbi:Glutamine amidotransferase subunit pdxT [Verticillium dahliae VDG1]|nr:Glutamine amidotransferase subunit pdxT [Verticillium dahliae VDG1]
MGNSYGEWAWEIPDGQPQGSGVYGHGAVLLPGNVMMTYGGFEISGSSSKVKRQQNSGSPRFLNLTSLSWGSSYTNPSSSSSSGGTGSGASEGSSKNDNKNETMKKVGLGVGLGVGLLAVIGAIIVWFCYRKRIRKQRQDRDRAVQGLAQDAARFLHADDEMVERDDPWSSNSWYTGGHDPYDQNSRSLGYETLRNNRSLLGGYGGNAPAGLLIPRKPVISKAARGAYQPTASRPSNLPTAGHIHPIYEADEEAPDGPVLMRDPDMGPETPTSQTYSDPFATPRHSGIEASTSAAAGPIAFLPPNRAALTPSPDRNHQRGFVDPEVQDWQSDVDAAEALFAQMPPRAGRGSPTRRASMRSARSGTTGPDDERTGSGLSDSNRSTFSSLLSRSGSAAGTARSYTPYRAAHTFSTAKSNFTSLQAEGPSLLLRGERSSPTREQHYQGGHARGSSYPHHGDDDDEEDNFIRERPDVTTGGFDPRSAPSPEPLRIQKKKSVEPVEEVMDEKAGAPSVAIPPPSSSSSSISIADEDLWAPARGRELRVPSAASERELKRISTTESGISESEPRPSLTLRTAEAVRIERPKTRVLRMVESFEVKSREGSPSPTRGSP